MIPRAFIVLVAIPRPFVNIEPFPKEPAIIWRKTDGMGRLFYGIRIDYERKGRPQPSEPDDESVSTSMSSSPSPARPSGTNANVPFE